VYYPFNLNLDKPINTPPESAYQGVALIPDSIFLLRPGPIEFWALCLLLDINFDEILRSVLKCNKAVLGQIKSRVFVMKSIISSLKELIIKIIFERLFLPLSLPSS